MNPATTWTLTLTRSAAPNLAWIVPGRILPGTQGYPNLEPNLAVEVKSPPNSNPEMAAKAWMWLSYG